MGEQTMPQNFYELVWIFIIYAFIGWCTEVSYAALDTGKFVNRGFLNGPYCPIYGCGVVIVVTILTPLKDNLLILFVGSFFLTSVLEFITGFILERVFHNKWWDYSDKPFNIKGYVCLKFSIYWGLACTFIMDILHPMIYKGITLLPYVVGVVLLVIFMGVFVVDCCITVSTILKFNKRLKVMDEMAVKIHRLSDEIGVNIYENVTGVIEKSEEFQENHAELLDKLSDTKEDIMELPAAAKDKIMETAEAAKDKIADTAESAKLTISENVMEAKNELAAKAAAITEKNAEWKKNQDAKKKEWEELVAEYNKMFAQKNAGFKRILKAFPDMKSLNQNETLQKYKNYFNIKQKIGNEKKNN